jgi:ribosomal protein L2
LLPGKGAQYCRAAGTAGRLIQLTKENQSVLIKLPSGIKKLFSYYSFACLGEIKLSNKKRFSNTKSGY